MKKTALILSCLLLSASALAENGVKDTVNGKRLYEEDPTKCISCHGQGEHFSADERQATDITKLESWVRNCDIHFKTNWFDDEIMDVVAYLDQTYYKFPVVDSKNGQTKEETVIVAAKKETK